MEERHLLPELSSLTGIERELARSLCLSQWCPHWLNQAGNPPGDPLRGTKGWQDLLHSTAEQKGNGWI